uniref:Apolipoprotein C-I n=1 Tax=Panagrellus redivivus TaxID=6233 RepID=A0A7E4VE26_PANRE
MRVATVITLAIALCAVPSQADWFDDFVDSIADKLHSGASYLKEEAAPVIRHKFNSVKETLQDPETHENVQTWVKEKALPVIQEKWGQFSSFVGEEVVPELKKVYDAANEAHEKVFTDKDGDIVIKQTEESD